MNMTRPVLGLWCFAAGMFVMRIIDLFASGR
jgi:hypothetical protein